MPAFHKIDKQHRLVLSTASGVFSFADIRLHHERLMWDPDFDPSFSQIADFRSVTGIEISADEIRQIAQSSVFSPHSRRALIMPNDSVYRLGRMYEILRGFQGEQGIRVVRSLEEALDWVHPKSVTT